MINIEGLTERGKQMYMDLVEYLQCIDFKRALLTSISDDLSFVDDILVDEWGVTNRYLTVNEKLLMSTLVNKYGLLVVQDVFLKIYIENLINTELINAGIIGGIMEDISTEGD